MPGSICAATRATRRSGRRELLGPLPLQTAGAIPPSPGGCDFLEDPALDARTAEPVWLPDPDPLISIAPAIVDGADTFSLWSLPGLKSLVHDGRRLLMRARFGRRDVRVALAPTLADGEPFAYAVPAGPRGLRSLKAAADLDEALTGVGKSADPALTRGDFVHMRALQALDADRDRASEREIAGLLFGAVDAREGWNDSAMRANVRYLLNHGRALRDGGYRDLIHPKPPTRNAAKP